MKPIVLKRKNKKTGQIEEKNYYPVNEKLKYFKEHFPGWSIITELIKFDFNYALFKSSIFDSDGNLISTGHALEEKASNFINETSWIENCETSAVGRALSFLGIGIDDEIASAEEVLNAKENFIPITLAQKEMILGLLETADIDIRKRQKVEVELDEYSTQFASRVIEKLLDMQPENDVEMTGGAGNQKALDKAIKNRLDRERN